MELLDENDFGDKIDILTDKIDINKNSLSELEKEYKYWASLLPSLSGEALTFVTDKMNSLKTAILENKKATYQYQKQIDQIRLDNLMQNADSALQEINRQIAYLVHSIEMMEGGEISNYKFSAYVETPEVDYSDTDEYKDKVDAEKDYQDQISYIKEDAITTQNSFEMQTTKSHLEEMKKLYLDYVSFIEKLMATIGNPTLTLDQKFSSVLDLISSQKDTILQQQSDVNAGLEQLQTDSQDKQANIVKDGTNEQQKITDKCYENINKETENHFTNQINTYTTALDGIIQIISSKFVNIKGMIESLLTVSAPTSSSSSSSSGGNGGNSVTDNGDTITVDGKTYKKYNQNDKSDSREYAKGTNSHPGGKAWVDDGNGNEIIIPTDSEPFMFKDKGAKLVDLPKGTEVIPAEESKEILKNTDIPRYEDGTVDNGKVVVYKCVKNGKLLVTTDKEKAQQYYKDGEEVQIYEGYYGKSNSRVYNDEGYMLDVDVTQLPKLNQKMYVTIKI
jgi:hypothetical protein